MMRTSRSAPPKASAMLESLRGLGYSTETAIADTIDNSIAASATKVDLIFHWAQAKSFIAIVDNGHGMTSNALESAMRLGDRDPLQKRGSRDLGRFGLGMKTAAFSQGRRLTVASRTATGEFSCFSWDLEILKASADGGWHLLEGADEDSLRSATGQDDGTSAPSSRPSPTWLPQSPDSPLSLSTKITSVPACP
jgi:hypothetical protein